METTLPVLGMTCQGCVKSLSRALQATPGVTSASVSLEQAQACVEHDPSTVTVQRLREVIADAGFETN